MREKSRSREPSSPGVVAAMQVSFSSMSVPRPFLKWVGGKRQILPALAEHIPACYGTYHEPFVGAGALFFAADPARAVLGDINRRLIRTWRGVRDDVERVIALLREYPHDRGFFLRMRERDIDAAPDHELAAWMIYLNKTAYNGLYRVNRRNIFNVPFGRYTNPTLCDATNLRACSHALRNVEIVEEDFASVLTRAKTGDFVYCDPPYVPLSATSSFTSYSAEGFGVEDQIRLRDVARDLKERGVHVLLSNSCAGFVREIYGSGFVVEEVFAARAVNCKAANRGKIVELMIR